MYAREGSLLLRYVDGRCYLSTSDEMLPILIVILCGDYADTASCLLVKGLGELCHRGFGRIAIWTGDRLTAQETWAAAEEKHHHHN